MKFALFTLGGTVDAERYPEDGPPPKFSTFDGGPSRVALAARGLLGSGERLLHLPICARDSKQIDGPTFQVWWRAAAQVIDQPDGKSSDLLISTLGSDRNTRLARSLEHMLDRRLQRTGKVMICLSAMMPLANAGKSNAVADLKLALAVGPTLDPGVYCLMNGRIIPARHARKNFRTGQLEDLRRPSSKSAGHPAILAA